MRVNKLYDDAEDMRYGLQKEITHFKSLKKKLRHLIRNYKKTFQQLQDKQEEILKNQTLMSQ